MMIRKHETNIIGALLKLSEPLCSNQSNTWRLLNPG